MTPKRVVSVTSIPIQESCRCHPSPLSIRVHVGDDEVLWADSRQFVERAVAAGVDARLDVWEGMPHGFVGGVGQMEAAAGTLKAIGDFLSSWLAPGA